VEGDPHRASELYTQALEISRYKRQRPWACTLAGAWQRIDISLRISFAFVKIIRGNSCERPCLKVFRLSVCSCSTATHDPTSTSERWATSEKPRAKRSRAKRCWGSTRGRCSPSSWAPCTTRSTTKPCASRRPSTSTCITRRMTRGARCTLTLRRRACPSIGRTSGNASASKRPCAVVRPPWWTRSD
jgi:hypothetical protein